MTIFLTPGPSQLHPELPVFMREALEKNIGSLSHRSKEFEKIFRAAAEGVRALLEAPSQTHVFFLGSATEAMERLVQNCCAAQSFHFVNGAFSERFLQTAQELGRQTAECRTAYNQGFPFSSTEIPEAAELVCVTHNETSTGVMVNLADVAKLKARYPKKLIALDVVSSAPYPTIPWSQIDAAFFSVQKSFGLPAGLGVLLVNDACLSKAINVNKAGNSIGSYHNFPTLQSFALKNQTPETPNVLGIFLLSKVCAALEKVGLGKLRADTDERAKLLYSFLDSGSSIKAFVADSAVRSHTVVTAVTPKAAETIAGLSKAGIEVGAGYGKFKDEHIRIANFCTHRRSDIESLITQLKKLLP